VRVSRTRSESKMRFSSKVESVFGFVVLRKSLSLNLERRLARDVMEARSADLP